MENKYIYLSPPDIDENEKAMLFDALNSNWIAPVGPCLDLFENEIAEYLGVKYACGLSSGTAGLHLALRILGIEQGDIVLCPSLTFAASANVILYEKAVPIFIDVDPRTWTIDINALEIALDKHRPKALISVDLYGQSCDYDLIKKLCARKIG